MKRLSYSLGYLYKLYHVAMVPMWKKRWFILNDGCLYYFKKPYETNPKCIMPLENIKIEIQILGSDKDGKENSNNDSNNDSNDINNDISDVTENGNADNDNGSPININSPNKYIPNRNSSPNKNNSPIRSTSSSDGKNDNDNNNNNSDTGSSSHPTTIMHHHDNINPKVKKADGIGKSPPTPLVDPTADIKRSDNDCILILTGILLFAFSYCLSVSLLTQENYCYRNFNY